MDCLGNECRRHTNIKQEYPGPVASCTEQAWRWRDDGKNGLLFKARLYNPHW